MAGMTETEVSGELFEFGEDRQFNAKIVGTRVDNPNIVKSNENSSTVLKGGSTLNTSWS